jgi:hypothetical protein
VAALRAVEWVDEGRFGDNNHLSCPWCGRFRVEGHHPDCQRQEALDAVEESAKNA